MLDKIDLTKNILGIIRIDLIDRAGKSVYSHTHKNMICISIRDAMSNLIVGDNVAAKAITKVAIGTDGSVYTNEITDFSQTDSTNKFTKSLVTGSWSYPDYGQVTVNFTIDYNEPAESMEVQEYGLFTEEGLLIARAVKPPINKTSEVAMMGAWTLIFS